MIVDDSALVRQTYRNLLESDPEIRVIGTASDPYIAVQKIQREKPDVITLDIEMPRMDGLTFLKKIMVQAPMPVLVISNQTLKGADVALRALEVGAVDVMEKPNLSSDLAIEESRILLVDKVRSAYFARRGAGQERSNAGTGTTSADRGTVTSRQYTASGNTLIAVGASTGGTEALKTFLQALPRNMPPIMVVQHMPEKFTASFARRLNEMCAITVKEAEDNEPVERNTAYIARGSYHMALRSHNGRSLVRIYQGELVNRHRPSVNVLFNSVAEVKGKHAIGIILTGMGDDGATGLLAMHQKGAYTIAQDEASCTVFGMPQKAILTGGVSAVLPLREMAGHVRSLLEV